MRMRMRIPLSLNVIALCFTLKTLCIKEIIVITFLSRSFLNMQMLSINWLKFPLRIEEWLTIFILKNYFENEVWISTPSMVSTLCLDYFHDGIGMQHAFFLPFASTIRAQRWCCTQQAFWCMAHEAPKPLTLSKVLNCMRTHRPNHYMHSGYGVLWNLTESE